ncbi:hypothetical protein PR048_011149 [Dryococelus australis]|uniref:Uncharacterized protein n=1 Tax=Dryococelus australis TaxID=614101 RepID=A0ABQ9HKR7_9NEOP|nr:hypothetical protein PR048_011149 [Dryococelus australis]
MVEQLKTVGTSDEVMSEKKLGAHYVSSLVHDATVACPRRYCCLSTTLLLLVHDVAVTCPRPHVALTIFVANKGQLRKVERGNKGIMNYLNVETVCLYDYKCSSDYHNSTVQLSTLANITIETALTLRAKPVIFLIYNSFQRTKATKYGLEKEPLALDNNLPMH